LTALYTPDTEYMLNRESLLEEDSKEFPFMSSPAHDTYSTPSTVP